jgi:hypothetical protein
VPASLLSVLCVRDLGIALGQGVWAGCVALISFLWGQLFFHAGMHDPLLGSVGIGFLVGGIAALGIISGGGCGSSGRPDDIEAERAALSPFAAAESTSHDAASPLKESLVSFVADRGDTSAMATVSDADTLYPGSAVLSEPSRHRPNKCRGLLLALGVGIGAGSTMVPLRLAPHCPYHAQGIAPLMFAVCFGVSTVPVSVIIFAG